MDSGSTIAKRADLAKFFYASTAGGWVNTNDFMKQFRKCKEPEQDALDETGTSPSGLLRKLKANGFYAFQGMSADEQRRVWNWSKDVIRQYRRVLEQNPASIRPVEELPFTKDEIRLAIKLTLPFYAQKNIHSMVKNLKTIYKELGCFQSIDAGDKEKLKKLTVRQGKAADLKYRDLLQIQEKYMQTVVSEKKSLIEEINNFLHFPYWPD
jgi:hypothetical protein